MQNPMRELIDKRDEYVTTANCAIDRRFSADTINIQYLINGGDECCCNEPHCGETGWCPQGETGSTGMTGSTGETGLDLLEQQDLQDQCKC